MSGNVNEWFWDWLGDYSGQKGTDLVGPDSDSCRVYRGGSWYDGAGYARVSSRDNYGPTYLGSSIGFRLSRLTP